MSDLMPEPLLRVRNIGKLYSRNKVDTRKKLAKAAWRALFPIGKPPVAEAKGASFWAVENVSFELHRGSAIGIIGLNGSGKTTTLRMLAGQLLPDVGEIRVSGTSAAMIDLQAGFQTSASGMENIFLRAAALGFTRRQTRENLQEIIDFSELGGAIGAPLNTYSSGMRMRLAFAIMTTVSPDLLLIDEVLAVGDFQFRQKCLAKVREMRNRSAFVFVSHSMGDVERFCDYVIVMHKGQILFEGEPKEAIEVYQALENDSQASPGVKKVEAAMGPTFRNQEAVSDVTHFWSDLDGNPIERVQFQQDFQLRVSFKAHFDVRKLIVGVPVWATNAHYVTGLSTEINSEPMDVHAGETVEIVLEVKGGFVNPGVLKSMIGITDGPEFLYRMKNPDLAIGTAPHPTWGAITVPHSWTKRAMLLAGEPDELSKKREA